jgi:hypothetical protein
MRPPEVSFSIARHSAWAPGLDSAQAWAAWAAAPFSISGRNEPAVRDMPAMQRRRAGFLGKMALEVAYQCAAGDTGMPTVFCSRHGEVARAIELLSELDSESTVSPTGFGLAVHNASAGLFSIARQDQANHVALAAGASTVEHAVIEACGLLADGARSVLLVAYDNRLPELFAEFEEYDEQPHAWAWLMVPAAEQALRLSWSTTTDGRHDVPAPTVSMPASLAILRFLLQRAPQYERVDGNRRWRWTRDA